MADVLQSWRRLNLEQRAAAVGALLLIVSTFGPFSFVEAALVVIGLAILLLLKQRADGAEFHLPFGDGTVVLAAGAWSAVLIVVRLFDRPLGQNLLALACAFILVLAGIWERQRRPADDIPDDDMPFSGPDVAPEVRATRPLARPKAEHAPAPGGVEVPAPEAPPEFHPGQLAMDDADEGPDAPTQRLPGGDRP